MPHTNTHTQLQVGIYLGAEMMGACREGVDSFSCSDEESCAEPSFSEESIILFIKYHIQYVCFLSLVFVLC